MTPNIKVEIIQNYPSTLRTHLVTEDIDDFGSYEIPLIVQKDLKAAKEKFFEGGCPPNARPYREALQKCLQDVIDCHARAGHLEFLPEKGFTHLTTPVVIL